MWIVASPFVSVLAKKGVDNDSCRLQREVSLPVQTSLLSSIQAKGCRVDTNSKVLFRLSIASPEHPKIQSELFSASDNPKTAAVTVVRLCYRTRSDAITIPCIDFRRTVLSIAMDALVDIQTLNIERRHRSVERKEQTAVCHVSVHEGNEVIS